MSAYEIVLICGSLALLVAVLLALAAYANKASIISALVFLLVGGGLIYYAYGLNGDELNFMDVPNAIYRLIGSILN